MEDGTRPLDAEDGTEGAMEVLISESEAQK